MWINLLSRDISADFVHPEYIAILGRLSPADAKLLLKIAETSEAVKAKLSINRVVNQIRATNHRNPTNSIISRLGILRLGGKPFDLNQTILENLNLIESDNGYQHLTKLGEMFLEAVSEPEESPSAPEESKSSAK
jgi:hypothetical protein